MGSIGHKSQRRQPRGTGHKTQHPKTGGTGHRRSRARQEQFSFTHTHWKFRHSHGGILRNSRKGRGARPLSGKDPLHLVLKVNRESLRSGLRSYRRYFLIHKIVDRYAKRFFIKIEQISIQNDHIHFLIRTSRRSQYQNFFRVTAGQIAQQFQRQGLVTGTPVTGTPAPAPTTPRKIALRLWKHRPFTRVVKGWRAYKIVRNYIELNEQEALHRIIYQKHRLKGLSSSEWNILWS